jgi:hypothetical protein
LPLQIWPVGLAGPALSFYRAAWVNAGAGRTWRCSNYRHP